MKTHPAFSQELWEQTPAEVRAYIEVLEARQASLGAREGRVVALEALVQTVTGTAQTDVAEFFPASI